MRAISGCYIYILEELPHEFNTYWSNHVCEAIQTAQNLAFLLVATQKVPLKKLPIGRSVSFNPCMLPSKRKPKEVQNCMARRDG